MAEQRQFRFRLPWLTAASAPPPRPVPEPQPQPPRPPVETPAPTQPTTATIPIQRPPFRPAGIAPVQPPPPPPLAAAPEPQPSRPTVETPAPTLPTTTPIPIQRPPLQPAGIAPVQLRPPPPAPEPQPPRPTVETPAPTQPTTTPIPIQRPPFLPAGIAQVQAPPPPPPPLPLPQPRSPPGPPTSGIQVGLRPALPSRAPELERAASVPPSPTRPASQPQAVAQTVPGFQSPRFAPRVVGRTYSQPSSPSKAPVQVQPTASQPSSPSKKLQPATQETSQPPPSASQQEEPKPVVSLPQSQEIQSKKETTPEVAPELSAMVAAAPAVDAPSEPVKEVKETEEDKKVAEAKPSDLANQEPKITKLHGAPSDSRTAFHTEQEQSEKEAFKRKKMIVTGSSNGEQIKIVSSAHPKPKISLSESHYQKPVISTGEQVPLHKQITDDISKFVRKLGTGDQKQLVNEKPVSIITLAGENRGAFMHVGSEPERKSGPVHIHRGYKTNPDDSAETTAEGETSSKSRKSKNPLIEEEQATKAYINSNTQSINNSIVFESSVTERNPGVQLSLSQNLPEPNKLEHIEMQKTEFNISRAEKLSCEPTIKRQCLRGPFSEPSDSDPENPEKP